MKYRWIGLAIALGALYLYGLNYIPLLAIDEPWYANTAHNFAHGLGLINTNAGWRGGDIFCLYPIALGLWLKIFPTTLYTTRLFSVFLLIPTLFTFNSLTQKFKFSPKTQWLTTTLFGLNSITYLLFRRARPEALIVLLWVIALNCWLKGKETGQNRWIAIAWAMVALAVIAHPYALAGGLALAILSFPYKRESIPVLLGISIPTAIFFTTLYITKSLTPLDILHSLTSSGRSLTSSPDWVSSIGINMKRFITDYTLSGKRALIAIFELGLLAYATFKTRHPIFIFGLLYLIISLIAFHPFFRWGVGPILISTTLAWGLMHEKFSNYWVRGLLLAYLIAQPLGTGWLIIKHHHNTPYHKIEAWIHTQIPPHTQVLSQMELWFPLQNNPITTQSSIHPTIIPPEYVVIMQQTGKTSPTFGKKTSNEPESYGDYFKKISTLTTTLPIPKSTFTTTGYGTIYIWKISCVSSPLQTGNGH